MRAFISRRIASLLSLSTSLIDTFWTGSLSLASVRPRRKPVRKRTTKSLMLRPVPTPMGTVANSRILAADNALASFSPTISSTGGANALMAPMPAITSNAVSERSCDGIRRIETSPTSQSNALPCVMVPSRPPSFSSSARAAPRVPVGLMFSNTPTA